MAEIFQPPGLSYLCLAPPLAGFIVFTCLALISLLKGWRNPTHLLFAGICLCGGLINIDMALVSLLRDRAAALAADRIVYLLFIFSIPVYIGFVHSFLGITRRRWIVNAALSLSSVLVFFTQGDLFITGLHEYSFGRIARAGPAYHVFSLFGAMAVLYCFFVLIRGMKDAAEGTRKNRIKYILIGMGLSTFLIFLNYLSVAGLDMYPPGNFSFAPAVVLAFGVLKYDLLDMDDVIRKGIVYSVLVGALTSIYFLIIFLFHILFVHSGYSDPVVLPLLYAFVIVLIFDPLKVIMSRFIDHTLFRGKYNYRRTLKEISGRMTSLLSPEEIARHLLHSVSGALQMGNSRVFIRDYENGSFRGYSLEGNVVQLAAGHPLVGFLEKFAKPLTRMAVQKNPALNGEKAVVEFFDFEKTSLAVPILRGDQLLGIIALGAKKSGELFVGEDIELLVTVAHQSAIAVENANNFSRLEKLNHSLEDIIRQRTAELARVLEEKERTMDQLIRSESLAAIGQLVAGTAHELNNPLASASSLVQTSIESLAPALRRGGDADEDIVSDLKFALKEMRRAKDIVASLLGITRNTQTYTESVDMNTVIDDALKVLYNQYKNLGIDISRDFDGSLPRVEGNFASLGQLCMNVIRNAIQAVPESGGKIVLATRHRKEAGTVTVTCRDNGTGIPHEIMKDIFKPFFTTKEAGRGSGLGLYISHEIARRHNGKISAESEIGAGTVFTIEIPCRRG
ncbi:MAG: ATP-binding protein [Syntrophales bacterium]